jgi:hypothetical protein
MPHKPFPDSVEISVLMKCKRRCALCYGLNNDDGEKRGQLAHIDRDGANVEERNAAFLCSFHHDLYDSTSHQSKGYMPGELKGHQETLLAYVRTIKNDTKNETKDSPVAQHSSTAASALDVYDRRMPIYRTTRQFVRDVTESLRPDLQLIVKFSADTDEALFLFDKGMAEYLETLFKNALRLHTIGLLRERMLTHPDEPDNYFGVLQEETGIAAWFAEQPDEIRARFAPFLRLS